MDTERDLTPEPYEPPAIESRERVDAPLVAVGSTPPTAAFHRNDEPERYEPPAIEGRERVDFPLVAAGAGS